MVVLPHYFVGAASGLSLDDVVLGLHGGQCDCATARSFAVGRRISVTTKIISMFASSFAAFILGLLLSPQLMGPAGDPRRADAAFSDGVFQATLDLQSGRRPHIASGRWSAEQDRLSFAKGYEQRWREFFKNDSSVMPNVDDAQLTGYWDGIVEGAQDGKSSRPFQVAGANKDQAALSVHGGSYNDSEKQHYLNGYAAGYKAGYSAQHELKTVASNHQ